MVVEDDVVDVVVVEVEVEVDDLVELQPTMRKERTNKMTNPNNQSFFICSSSFRNVLRRIIQECWSRRRGYQLPIFLLDRIVVQVFSKSK